MENKEMKWELVSIDFLQAMTKLSRSQRRLLVDLLKFSARNLENALTIYEISCQFDLSYEVARRHLKTLKQVGFLKKTSVVREGSPKRVHAYYVDDEIIKEVKPEELKEKIEQGKVEIPMDKASQKSAMLNLLKPFPIRPIDFKEGK